jgi:hypothetical protein
LRLRDQQTQEFVEKGLQLSLWLVEPPKLPQPGANQAAAMSVGSTGAAACVLVSMHVTHGKGHCCLHSSVKEWCLLGGGNIGLHW